ncbi:glycine/sarcosine/betaine reductase complex component C subunit beta [Slackia heliotrinireducens]|uniref:glycine/sarcosine/betaine reductase complex component C subunit beta n=1 Tax=Slackia heliotrinireducens TaxID=84110 RepID=UPI0033160A6D
MKSVIKGTGYVLVHTPDMVIENGATQTTERVVNPEGEYLKALPNHIRTWEQVLEYWPNQVYIGNKTPDELKEVPFPWYDKPCDVKDRYGKFGQMMPEAEFYLLMQVSDVFDLVDLEAGFVAANKEAFFANKMISEDLAARVKDGVDIDSIKHHIDEEHAEPLFINGEVVGCVKRAHEIDVNLSAHTMLENIVSKASSVLALLTAVESTGIAKGDIQYVIDCSEEACGDVLQRGGGNFAKAAAEIAGLENATGSDTRGFCAGPSHALIEAASLVQSGAYDCVAVTAGGCTAKLGMNGKSHVEKGMPVLEDMLGGFCIILGANDGVNPEINLEAIGRHTVGTGSAPQAVIQSLAYNPLEKLGLKATDIDRFSPEMQNPDITKPAGAGDVPEANYKMIAALGVKKGEIEKKEMPNFIKEHGITGFAPTQGHIPSGVPSIGFLRDLMLAGDIQRAMIIGKGSLFLGRLTNLFDGTSFIIQANSGETETAAADEGEVRGMVAKFMREFAESMLEAADAE